MVKDLGSINGTYVNDEKISEEDYLPLEDMDTLRFGYDPMVYRVERQREPPSPQVAAAQGQVPRVQDLPTWAARKIPPSMAECQGCIAEQGLNHICGMVQERAHAAGHIDQQANYSNGQETVAPPGVYSRWPQGVIIENVTSQSQPVYTTHSGQPRNMQQPDPEGHPTKMKVVSPQSASGTPMPPPVSTEICGSSMQYVPDSNMTGTTEGNSPLMRSPTAARPTTSVLVKKTPSDSSVPSSQDLYSGKHVPGVMSPPVPSSGSVTYRKSAPDVSIPSHHTSPGDSHGIAFHGANTGQDYPITGVPHHEYASGKSHMTQPGHHMQMPSDGRIKYAPDDSDVIVIDGQSYIKQGPHFLASHTPHVIQHKSFNPAYDGDYYAVPSQMMSAPSHVHSYPQNGHAGLHRFNAPQTVQSEGIVYVQPHSSHPLSSSSDPVDLKSAMMYHSMHEGVSDTQTAQTSSPEQGGEDSKKKDVDKGGDAHKKGTPLYGQPSWWGEDNPSDGYSYPHTATLANKPGSKQEGTDKKDVSGVPSSDKTGATKDTENMDKPKNERRFEPTYMEISLEDSSGAKPPLSDPRPAGTHTPPVRDTGPGDDDRADNSMTTSGTAFTIDMGDDTENKLGKSLSEFLPNKIRRSFRQRSTQKISKSKEDEDGHSGDGQMQRSGYLSEGNKSLISSEDEDLSIKSDTFTTQVRKSLQTGRPKSSQNRPMSRSKTPTKSSTPSKTSTRPKTPTAKVPPRPKTPRSKESEARKPPMRENLRATKSTPYLIEKMFSSDQSSQNSTKDDMNETATEFVLYKEARAYSTHSVSSSKDPARFLSLPKVQPSSRQPQRAKPRHGEERCIKDDDNISEAGTYTIEAEANETAEKQARESIDRVFGVEDLDREVIRRPVIDGGNNRKSPSTPPTGTSPVSPVASSGSTRSPALNQTGDLDSGKSTPTQSPVPSAAQERVTSPGSRKPRPGSGRRLPTPPVTKSGSATPTRSTEGKIQSVTEEGEHTEKEGEKMAFLGELIDTGRESPVCMTPLQSTRSVASIDTNVLLQDTDQVMQVIATRKPGQRSKGSENRMSLPGEDTDSESESTCAVVNGISKPGTSQSRDRGLFRKSYSVDANLPPKAVSRRDLASGNLQNMSTREKVMRHLQSKTGSKSNFSADFEDLGHSDGHSESEGHSESASYTSTDISEMSSKYGGSQRLGGTRTPMSSTRTNRAFALRRAKADGTETPPSTPRSYKSDDSRPKSAKARAQSVGREQSRPSSAKETSRTDRSDASLGAQIVRKSRENNRAKSVSPFQRADMGRNSLRDSRERRSLGTGVPARRAPDSKNKPAGQQQGALAVTGLKSQTSSRTVSPKTAKYSAWKKRKEYDPRKAVVEAKGKSKEGSVDDGKSKTQRSLSATADLTGSRLRPRSGTNSSVSSDDYVYDDDNAFLGSTHGSEISQMSSALASNLDNLSKNLDSGQTTQELVESYDNLMISSCYQLTLKLKAQTERMMEKLREQREVSSSPSPVDDVLNQPDIPANKELVCILKNLRKIDHSIKVMDRALFPDLYNKPSDPSVRSPNHQHYLQELERIQTEISGFKPIQSTSTSGTRAPQWRRFKEKSVDRDSGDAFEGDEYY